ncbi:hypothetical protein ABEF95_001745 [Exophiala dermatitidis]
MLGAKDEFRIYLLMYAKRLGAEGLRLKVEELLRTLVGGIVEEEDDDTENGGENSAAVAVMKNSNPNAVPGRNWHEESKTICGWPREELLKDVVLLLGKHRDLQRITVPYARMLRIVDADGGASGTNGSNPDEMAL